MDDGLAVRDLYLDVLAPALIEVGRRWQNGNATVAQEHLVTALVASIMATVAPRLGTMVPTGRHAVLACTDGEFHAIGLRMVADFLDADGWTITFVGASTPGDDLTRLVAQLGPEVVGLSTSLTSHLETASATIARIRRLPKCPLILVGGRAYRDDADFAVRLGADAFAADAASAQRLLRARFLDA